MENIKQIESILYVSKQKLGDQTYIELMRYLSGIYSHVCEHKNLENGSWIQSIDKIKSTYPKPE